MKVFVLCVTLTDERQRGAADSLPLVTHAAVVVDHEPDADGDIFMLEERDLLEDFVFEDLEVLLFQANNGTAVPVRDRYRNLDQLDVNADLKVLARFLLELLCSAGYDRKHQE